MEPIKTFEVSIYGDLVPFEKNPLLSKARLRIFYKYKNRNRTFIDDDFAEKLLDTLPYTPVSGIWDEEEEDFTDHGQDRNEGRIYGIVPQDPHRTWEDHKDSDGVVRKYACCDVVLFTSRYPAAASIIGKKHSMELYAPSIRGEWVKIDGKQYYKYSDASFIGLQVLGDNVEPCFEGSAFYTYSKSLMEMIQELEKYTCNGGKEMKNFKLSDRAKFEALWDMLNPNFNEENGWAAEYQIIDVYDDYALCYNFAENKYERVKYSKKDEDNTVEILGHEETFIMDVSAAELSALKAIQAMNEGNFESIDAKYQTLVDDNATLNQKIGELSENVETMTASLTTGADALAAATEKIQEFTQTIETKDNEIAQLNSDLDSLKAFKAEIDKQEKLAEIAKYSMLDSAVIDKFTAEVDNYTLDNLTKELKIAYVDSQAANIFTQQNSQSVSHSIPTQVDCGEALTGAAKLVNNHMKNGGKD